jgi:hypothetical protein
MYRLLVVMIALSFIFACSRKKTLDSSAEDEKKACEGIAKKASKEVVALVQPPALNYIKTKSGGYKKMKLPEDMNAIVGINLKAVKFVGVFRRLSQNSKINAFLKSIPFLLGLDPGKHGESLLLGVKLNKQNTKNSDLYIYLKGNFQSKETINKIKLLTESFSNENIPKMTLTSSGGIATKYMGYNLLLNAPEEDLLLVTNSKQPSSFVKNSEILKMKDQIPSDTSVWVVSNNIPNNIPNMPKVLKKFIYKIKMFSGYINSDRANNIEVQFRIKFINAYAAKQAKGLINLGLSQVLNRLGPRINKSFNLGNSGRKNIVTRGAFLRILFRLDRYQVKYLIKYIEKLFKSNPHWIPGLRSAITPNPKMGEFL